MMQDQLTRKKQDQDQILILQRMRELEKEINNQKKEQETIKDIIKVDNISLNPMLKLNEAYLVELEDEKGQLLYKLYSENGIIGVSNEEGKIVLDEDYIAEMDEKFGKYGPEYLIPAQSKELDPQTLQSQSADLQKQSQLEQNTDTKMVDGQNANTKSMNEQHTPNEKAQEDENAQENNNSTIGKMEDDLGCDITSCVRIEDENFSKEVLGHQTGHKEKYIAYSKSRNTFILIGDTGNHFEEIQDICGAQGGGQAAQKKYMEYDEQGNPTEVESPEFVMTRRDGTQGALAIDMHYGAICVSNLTPSKQNNDKYTSEEMRIGHSIRPTPDEIEVNKQREQEAIKEKGKEQEVAQMEPKDEKEEDIVEDDDDLYDWSTGRPVPRH